MLRFCAQSVITGVCFVCLPAAVFYCGNRELETVSEDARTLTPGA